MKTTEITNFFCVFSNTNIVALLDASDPFVDPDDGEMYFGAYGIPLYPSDIKFGSDGKPLLYPWGIKRLRLWSDHGGEFEGH